VLCPDAAHVLEDRWQALTPEQRRSFPPLCPDLVIELASVREASPSDSGPRGVTALLHKMERYQVQWRPQVGFAALPFGPIRI